MPQNDLPPNHLSRRLLLAGGAVAATAPAWRAGSAGARAGTPPVARLNDNENPYGPSPAAMDALIAAARTDAAHYPEPYVDALAAVIAAEERLPVDCLVFGGGSSEVLHAAAACFGIGSGEVVAPALTFSMLPNYVRTVGGTVVSVPMAGWQIDLDAVEAALTPQTRLVYLCNPNNPTGQALDPAALRSFCRRVAPRVPVFIDECYIELTAAPAEASMVDLVREGLPVILSRTFSKLHGMAGLRVGFGMAPEPLARRIDRFRMSLLNVPGLAAARASLLDAGFRKFSRDMIGAGRARIVATLDALGLVHVPSTTNFVLFEAGRPARALVAQLEQQHGVLIAARWPGLPTHARVSTGRLEDIARFDRAMRAVYRAG